MRTYLFISLMFLISACSSSSINEKINKAGDIAGQTAGEFIEGASHGVQKAFDVQVALPQNLASKGLRFGKASVTNGSEGADNLLVLYIIFDRDFKGKLTAKAFDNKSLEMGRASVSVEGKANDAQFYEFHFDKRTNIDSDSKITIE